MTEACSPSSVAIDTEFDASWQFEQFYSFVASLSRQRALSPSCFFSIYFSLSLSLPARAWVPPWVSDCTVPVPFAPYARLTSLLLLILLRPIMVNAKAYFSLFLLTSFGPPDLPDPCLGKYGEGRPQLICALCTFSVSQIDVSFPLTCC